MHRRLVIAFVVVLGLALLPRPLATIEGPCEATIAGEDVVARDTFARSDAISVPQTGGVPVTMTAERADRSPEARDRVRRHPLRGQRRADDRQIDDRCRPGRRLREVRHRPLQDRRDEHRRGLHVRSHRARRRAGQPARDGRGGDRDRAWSSSAVSASSRSRSAEVVQASRRCSRCSSGSSSQPGSGSCSSSTGSSTRRRSRRSSSCIGGAALGFLAGVFGSRGYVSG